MQTPVWCAGKDPRRTSNNNCRQENNAVQHAMPGIETENGHQNETNKKN